MIAFLRDKSKNILFSGSWRFNHYKDNKRDVNYYTVLVNSILVLSFFKQHYEIDRNKVNIWELWPLTPFPNDNWDTISGLYIFFTNHLYKSKTWWSLSLSRLKTGCFVNLANANLNDSSFNGYIISCILFCEQIIQMKEKGGTDWCPLSLSLSFSSALSLFLSVNIVMLTCNLCEHAR